MDDSTKLKTKGELALLATTLIWGTSFVFAKILLVDVSPILYLILRCLIASIVFLLLFPKEILKGKDKDSIKNGFILGMLLSLGLTLQNYGLQLTTASKSAFLTSLMVIFAPIFQVIILKNKPTQSNIIGIFIVLIGSYFLTMPTSANFNFGDLLNIIAAILFGLYTVILDKYSRGKSAIQLSFYQIFSCFLIGLVFIPFEKVVFNYSTSILINLLYLSLLAAVVAVWIQTEFQKYTTPSKAAVIFSIEPVIATIAATYFLSESFTTKEIYGAVFILFGILFSEIGEGLLNYIKLNYSSKSNV